MNRNGRLVLFVMVISLTLDQGSCLWCYQCISNQSWTDCETRLYRRQCQDPEAFCISAEIHMHRSGIPQQLYSRMCSTTYLCSGSECLDFKATCRLMCCNSDYCNGDVVASASGPKQSDFVIIGTVLMAFILLGG